MSSIHDAAPEDFKKALSKKWTGDARVHKGCVYVSNESGSSKEPDYYDWAKGSSYPVFGDWEPKSNKKKVAACPQPQVKENIWSFSGMSRLMEEIDPKEALKFKDPKQEQPRQGREQKVKAERK